jgi:hypothetical protein
MARLNCNLLPLLLGVLVLLPHGLQGLLLLWCKLLLDGPSRHVPA